MTRRILAVVCVALAVLAVLPADALAQRGRGGGGGGRGPTVVLSPQRTVVYPPWYGPFGGGYGYPYQYPYQYPYPYPYRGYNNEYSADLRIQTTPRETEVYVDGARAGIVDDFDGIFQRLHVTPGEHEITLYLAGFRTWSEVRYFQPRSDTKILHTMLQLAPGQPDDPRPMPIPRDFDRDLSDGPRMPSDGSRIPNDAPMPGDRRQPPSPPQPRNPPPPDQPQAPNPPRMPNAPDPPNNAPRNTGTLSVGIEPGDAEITLDGQRQSLPNGQTKLIIQLSEGVHRLVIQKAGFQTWETDLQIRRGRTLAFTVSLVK